MPVVYWGRSLGGTMAAYAATVRGPKRFFTIRGGDHNDMAPRDAHAYWEAVDGFVEGL